jgi:prepilin peptidase CpaA
MSSAPSIAVLLRTAILIIAIILLAVASLNDIATRSIPDFTALGLVIIGIAARLADHSAVAALTGSASVFILGALCWRFGWLGGGDVKLLTACCWLVPPPLMPQLVLVTAIAGGVLALLYLGLSYVARMWPASSRAKRPRSLAGRIARAEWWRIQRLASLPYGCAIAFAALLTLNGG